MGIKLDRVLAMIAELLGPAAIVVALKAAWWACSPGSARHQAGNKPAGASNHSSTKLTRR